MVVKKYCNIVASSGDILWIAHYLARYRFASLIKNFNKFYLICFISSFIWRVAYLMPSCKNVTIKILSSPKEMSVCNLVVNVFHLWMVCGVNLRCRSVDPIACFVVISQTRVAIPCPDSQFFSAFIVVTIIVDIINQLPGSQWSVGSSVQRLLVQDSDEALIFQISL